MSKVKEWLNEEKLMLVSYWAKKGLIDTQIAENIGIVPSTLYEWKKKYPEFSEALKAGKEVADAQVFNALHQSAIGFHYLEEAVTNTGEVVTVKKYSKPNVTAQIYWLKNRVPDDWRDKQEIEQINKNIDIKVGTWDDNEE
jgi:transposase-like protein